MSTGSLLHRVADAATVVAALASVSIAGTILFRGNSSAAAAMSSVTSVENWQHYAENGQRLGPEMPVVTIVEFGDYQCPYCRDSEPHLNAIRRQYPNDVARVYRHYPLPNHVYADEAAWAAECAAKQDSFWRFHDLLFSTTEWTSGDITASLSRIAAHAGVPDSLRFAECMKGDAVSARLAQDRDAVNALGITATPTFLINGQLHRGLLDSLQLAVIVDEIVGGL